MHSVLPTSLIICSTRELFLSSLLACLARHPPHHCAPTSPAPLDLLTPTIALLYTTSAISLAFCPTVDHLRAYLSVFALEPAAAPGLVHARPLPTPAPAPAPALSPPPSTTAAVPALGLFNAVTLHRTTSAHEYSAQGISRTFAVAVEAAARTGLRLVIADFGAPADVGAEAEAGACWVEERLPLLNDPGMGMGMGRGGGDMGILGRDMDHERIGSTVSIRNVLGRWCDFEESTAAAGTQP
ncbi:MAG: hypothetical protein M1826_000655 [Phylliscum demangeonii]|nr:MAG: hypothetical protein M1826_000655 [Phylliscum demangeonii]